MIRTLPLAALALASAPALAKTKEPPVAISDGKPESCIPIAQIRESRVLDDRTIDFFVGNRVYRNALPNSCPELGFERAFSYETSLSQLCSTDIITVIHQGASGMRGASCGLGQFRPVKGVR